MTVIFFSFQYIDADGLIYWHMAQDLSEFTLHEPFFYGQAYNFPLEAYFAVPLLWLGISVQYALPIASAFISIFPFILFSIVLYRKERTLASFWILTFAIGMTIEYDIITSLSRGFTNGIFFCSFLIYPILAPARIRSYLILGLVISIGFVTNPNILVIALPVSFYLFLENFSNPKFYLYSILGILPALTFYYFAQQFYIINPDYVSHKMWIIKFSWEDLVTSFSNLDGLFKYLTPFYWKGHWLILLFPLITGFYLLKKDWKKGITLLFSVIFIIFTLGINKIHDDVGTIFFSSSRMFLAVPLLASLCFIWLFEYNRFSSKYSFMLLFGSIIIIGFKGANIKETVQFHVKKGYFGPITIIKVADLKSQVESIYSSIKGKQVNLFVCIPSDNFAQSEIALVAYGARFMVSDFPETNFMNYERRSWNFIENKTIAKKNIILYNCLLGEKPNISEMETEVIQLTPDMLLIKNNDKTVLELAEIFKFPYLRD